MTGCRYKWPHSTFQFQPARQLPDGHSETIRACLSLANEARLPSAHRISQQ